MRGVCRGGGRNIVCNEDLRSNPSEVEVSRSVKLLEKNKRK